MVMSIVSSTCVGVPADFFQAAKKNLNPPQITENLDIVELPMFTES